jgi:hypothetical protein
VREAHLPWRVTTTKIWTWPLIIKWNNFDLLINFWQFCSFCLVPAFSLGDWSRRSECFPTPLIWRVPFVFRCLKK